ncbi:hypothetical protein [Prosthecobacter sp.]|uniref:hypothetical protein n=1 Tax=Prosthecobacter sp. TaxID=1965333 RepID=UPI0037841071
MPETLPLTCHLAYLGGVPRDIVPPEGPAVVCSDGVTRSLPEVFGANSHDMVELTLDTTRLQGAAKDAGKAVVTIADLHSFTSEITGNSRDAPAGPLRDIALIYAPALEKHPEIRGLMFDTGFKTDLDDSNWAQWAACCREGCAVFLQSIRNTRTKSEEVEQTAYTSVHELGHVFNLLHTDDPCFLRSSPDDSAPPRTWYRFNADNRAYLTDCLQPAVYPGGNPFGDHAYMGSGDVRQPHAQGRPPLELEIQTSRDEFLPFEPVELDMTLSLVPGARVPRGLRNEMDPAYSSFTIWIEDPRGERRRYRSINHCCDNPAPCKVGPGRPVTRDLTLFGQSGGYTFRHAGVHRVWITWRLSPKLTLSSNTLEINVRPWHGLTTTEQRLCKVLRKAGRPLFYRKRLWSRRENEALTSLCADFRGKAQRFAATMATHARWHIQRDLARHNAAYRKQHEKHLRERARWLHDQDLLGDYRRRKVRQALETMEEGEW